MKQSRKVSSIFQKVETEEQNSSLRVLKLFQKNITQLFISDKNMGISRWKNAIN